MFKSPVFMIAFAVTAFIAFFVVNSQTSVPDFAAFPAGKERKTAFITYFSPIVLAQNQAILETREILLALQEKEDLGWWDRRKVSAIATKYRMKEFDVTNVEQWEVLLQRVDVIPASLALTQGAKESSWGSSRFAREGNNFFGQWCFSKGCGLVPSQRDDDKNHEVAVFDSPKESVAEYLRNLNTHDAYVALRAIRTQLKKENKPVTGNALAQGLSRYSEEGQKYVEEVRSMIRVNNFAQYDG